MGFSFEPEVTGIVEDDNSPQQKKAFRMRHRDTGENKALKHLQVEDLSAVTDENTIFVWDFDGVPFKVCSSSQQTYIIAKNKDTGEEGRHNNSTDFKGRAKIPPAKSWLGRENIKRDANGLPPLSAEDFEITKHQEPKKGETLETIIDGIQAYIDDVQLQFGIKNFLFCLGEGDVFRHKLPLPKTYKGQRDLMRPLYLKESRKWVMDNLPSEMAPEGFECDDLVEWYAAKGYQDYKKTGIFSYVLLCEDKDAYSNPKALCVYARGGTEFKDPRPIIIEDSSVSVGDVELVPMKDSNKLVGSGLKWLCCQAFATGDQADGYFPYNHLPQSYKDNIDYGLTQAYKDYVNLTTPREVLQKSVDNFYKWFPRGLQYKDCHGIDQDMDTLAYMSMMFTVAYMTRSQDDKTKLTDLLDYFNVDYKALVDNNKQDELPLADEEDLRSNIKDIRESLSALQDKSGVLSYKKSEKKELLLQRMDDALCELKNIESLLDNFYKGV